jgi:hypothetical protein
MEALTLYGLAKVIMEHTTYPISMLADHNVAKMDIVLWAWRTAAASTVYRVLKEHSYRVYKRTIKPGLKKKQMKERLQWCLDYED